MAAQEKRASTAAPILAVIALAGIAGVAYFAYRRVSEKGGPDVGDLLAAADKASQKLEARLTEFADALRA